MAQRERPQAQREYTWNDALAAIGMSLSDEREEAPADEVVEQVAVTRFCEVWEIGNPIYWSKEVSKQAGYRNAVAPWSSIKQTFSYKGAWRPGAPTRFPPTLGHDESAQLASWVRFSGAFPAPATSHSVQTNNDIEFFEPLCVGDRLTVRGSKLHNVRPRETRIGVGAFVDLAYECYNQRGQLVARVIQGSFRYNIPKKG